MVEMIRDPRYLLPLGLLVAVIMISFAIGRGDTHAQSGERGPATTAAPQPTPDDAAVDARRTGDLQRLSDALGVYRERHGSYPSTRNTIAQVCSSDSDAGCALKAITGDLVFSDGDEPYYYASDGARYVLMARGKTAGDPRSCPVGLPAELAAGAVICMSGDGGKN